MYGPKSPRGSPRAKRNRHGPQRPNPEYSRPHVGIILVAEPSR